MRNHYNETPRSSPRDVGHLDMAKTRDRNHYVETLLQCRKRKQFARIYYKLVDQWKLEPERP